MFLAVGFVFARQEGSHRSYSRVGTLRPLVIPTYDEVPVAVSKSNLKTADLSRDQYFRYAPISRCAAAQFGAQGYTCGSGRAR